MFISCPHCHDLVAIAPETRLPPAMCARCGGALQEMADTPADRAPAPGRPSIASLLRGGETGKVAGTAAEGAAVAEPGDAVAGEAAIHADMETDMAAISDLAETNALPLAVLQEQMSPADADAMQTPGAAGRPAPLLLLSPPTPSFTRQVARTPAHPRAVRWQWAALIVLSLSLVVQVLIADRARLAADAGWRPMITRLCGALGCSVPAWHQPGAFAMLSRDVRPIANTPGGLHVQATFRNDARWPQPWPVLLLSLSDADGRVLGARAFSPGEYLGATASQSELAPGQSARIALQLREPDPNVVAFSFDFR